ncbi:MAG: chromosome partitioning protein ParB [Actinomycetota bacterium]|nr:chromosome partitioning protein ParB [Actinomycetota bacterium]
MAGDTGFPQQDAQSDFSRARRRQILGKISGKLRREPDDIDQILPFDEVIDALGKTGERVLGTVTIDLDSIVGTVDRGRDFDRSFRPTSHRVRQRWERIATAMRRGESMPPIEVYRIGSAHFVKDGHHRVSVARQLGLDRIEARVVGIRTAMDPGRLDMADLPLKSHQRLFFERVPLAADLRGRIVLHDGRQFAELAEAVEAWGFRAMQAACRYMNRQEVAALWFRDEYDPVAGLLRDAGLQGDRTETEAYLAVSSFRYMLLRTHSWDEEVIRRIREAIDRRGGMAG